MGGGEGVQFCSMTFTGRLFAMGEDLGVLANHKAGVILFVDLARNEALNG